MLRNIFVAVDLGNTKAVCVIGKVDDKGYVEVLGKGLAYHKGMNKGIIVDIDEISEAIEKVIIKAENEANVHVRSTYININCNHSRVITQKVTIPVINSGGVVNEKDLERLLNQLCATPVDPEEQIADVAARQYFVDAYDGIVDPTGMSANTVGIEADLVIAKKMYIQSITKSLENIGIKLDGIIMESLAQSTVVLSEEQKEKGVILIDVGAITDICIVEKNKVIFTAAIPVGGNHITNDLAACLKISIKEAEKAKQKYELALSSLIENDQEMYVRDLDTHHHKTYHVSEVVEIIEARLFEILELAHKAVSASGLNNIPKSIVLAGAGIQYMDGVCKMAEAVFKLPVKLATLRSIGHETSEYGVALSMIYYIKTRGKRFDSESEILTEDDKEKIPLEGYREVFRRIRVSYKKFKKKLVWLFKHLF